MVDQPGIGRYPMPGTPLDFGAVERIDAGPAPELGEHTEQILANDLGLANSEIAKLFDKGIVAGPVQR